MSNKFFHRLIAASVFLISLIQFFMTAQPSVSFWDPGELSAAAYALEVPHPPGGPLFSLVGHMFYLLPLPGNIGFRMNTVSVVASAFSVLLLYLIAVRLMKIYKGAEPQNLLSACGTYFSAAIGALAFSFCDSVWFNGVESNYFAASTLLFSLIVWLTLLWYEKSEERKSWRYLLLIAYLIGLSPGVHLMSVLSIVTVVMVVVFKRYVTDNHHCKTTAFIFLGHCIVLLVIALAMWNNETSQQPPSPEEYKGYDTNFILIMGAVSAVIVGLFWKKVIKKDSFYSPILFGGIALAVSFGGIFKLLPSLLRLLADDSSLKGIVVLAIFLAVLSYIVYWSIKKKRTLLAVVVFSVMLNILGFTTFTTTIIRANQHPAMNENQPVSFSRLVEYLNREQYGDWPIFKRRWSGEPQHQRTWTNYKSDLDFFWRYQIDHMYNRYLLWNFAGRESTIQDTGVNWKQLYGIPFLAGLLGVYFHFRKDWKMASSFLVLFILMGYGILFYPNGQEMQPRERDYFYAGSYFVFALWISLGIRGLLDVIEKKSFTPGKATSVFAGILVLGTILIPGRMLQTNYFTHDRSKNWVPWDYAYDLLQTCAPNAILFTGGDNDTFPLWYLQDVEGIRRDVRIVNLSLVNTGWYARQLKHDTPYGAAAVKISLSDDALDRLQYQPVQWVAQELKLPVPREVIDAYQVTDTSVVRNGAITFTMPPTLSYGTIGAIRMQDVMVREIVMGNAWQRPIYFANTCGEDAKIGLADYLRIQGLASRLAPVKRNVTSSMRYAIDEPIMRRNLLEEPPSVSKMYQPGFLFRGLNDSTIFFDENEERMVLNCRGSFMMLASYYIFEARDKDMCMKTLNRMEQVAPRNVVKMDYMQNYYMASMYYACGATAKFREAAGKVEESVLARLSENPADVNEINSLYQILLETYDKTAQYSKAEEMLERLLPSYPQDAGLKRQIERYKALAAQQKSGQLP
ncbi:MAG: DUF2723 domain-containing protein [Bacteroidota bacterium]|jgi:hypothetical protein